MLKTLQNAFKIKEVREKLLYTFFMLVVTRIGSQLPIPGVNTTFFQELFTRQSNDAFGFFNTITGGSFTNMSVFALSITPYITSSIIMQLLTIAIPKLEEMQQEGEDGRKKIAESAGKVLQRISAQHMLLLYSEKCYRVIEFKLYSCLFYII